MKTVTNDVQVSEATTQVNVAHFFKTIKNLELMTRNTRQAEIVKSLKADIRKLATSGKKEKALLVKIQQEITTLLNWINSLEVQVQ